MTFLLRIIATAAYAGMLFLIMYLLSFETAVFIGIASLAADHILRDTP